MPIFPDVPNVPGVPPLLRNPNDPVAGIAQLLTGDGIGLAPDSAAPSWGIFDSDGNSVIDADNTVDVAFDKDWNLSTYNQEQGAFQTYNKVENPFGIPITFSAGGSETNRSAFLASIEAIAGDTNLYDVVTPEKTYQNCNIQKYGYKRTNRNGRGLIHVTIMLLEIRNNAQQSFSTTNVKAATSAAPTNNGTVNTQDPTPNQSALAGLAGAIE